MAAAHPFGAFVRYRFKRIGCVRRIKVETEVVEKNQNTNFVFNNIFFFENHSFTEIMWKKYCRAGRATDDYMARAHCVLDN